MPMPNSLSTAALSGVRASEKKKREKKDVINVIVFPPMAGRL